MKFINCSAVNHVTPIIKVADFCNFTCDFCRYPKNPHKSLMPFSTFRIIIEKACEYNLSNNYCELDVVFHGGEPLLWGYENFRLAIELQKELSVKFPKLIFRNSIQTNGALLNDQWIDFLYDNNFDIGISIDGPSEINFHKGPISDKVVIENINKLAQKNCKFGILSVITNEHAGWADRYYDFLVENNIHSVGLCYCMYDEEHKITVKNDILSDFLKRFFDRYFEGTYKLNVREFDNVLKLCMGVSTGSCAFSKRQRCGNFFSIRPNGDVYFCDPYTLEVPALGNILNSTFSDIKNHPNLLKTIIEAKEGAIKECANCAIKNICGGGCYRSTFSDGKNAFCDTYKSLYPYIESKVCAFKEQHMEM